MGVGETGLSDATTMAAPAEGDPGRRRSYGQNCGIESDQLSAAPWVPNMLVSGRAVSVAIFCALAASSLLSSVIISNCFRVCEVDTSTSSVID